MIGRLPRIVASCALGFTIVAAAVGPSAPTFAAGRPYAPPSVMQTASGQISMVLSPTEFVLALPDGDALAVNLSARTRILNETAGNQVGVTSTPASGGTSFVSGEFVAVHYVFAPATGAVASTVTLSTAPLATGRPHRLSGLVTAVGSGSFELEGAGGETWTITLVASTRMFAKSYPSTPAAGIGVGDFATALVRSGPGINDALTVSYGNRPYGERTQGINGTLASLSGQSLSVTQPNGATRAVQVLPTATITLNGQIAGLTSIGGGAHLHLVGSVFQGVFYAYIVQATA